MAGPELAALKKLRQEVSPLSSARLPGMHRIAPRKDAHAGMCAYLSCQLHPRSIPTDQLPLNIPLFLGSCYQVNHCRVNLSVGWEREQAVSKRG